MVGSTTYSDDSVSWAMAGTPWILCSVWWVRCGAEPVLVYRRQPGMSIVWSPVLPRFFIFPRRQPLTTLVRLSFILRDSPGPDKKRSLNSEEASWHLKVKHFAKITIYKKINYSIFMTTSSLGYIYIEWEKSQSSMIPSTPFKFSYWIFVWPDKIQTIGRTNVKINHRKNAMKPRLPLSLANV